MMELADKQIYIQEPGFFKSLSLVDWVYGAGLLAAALFGLARYGEFVDIYEKAILLAAAPTFAWLGWYWKPVRWLIPAAALLSLFAISLYGGQLDMANQKFFLKYMLSSQSAILWMGTLFVLATLFYWISLITRTDFGSSIGSVLCWAGVVLGLTGMLVRWYEFSLITAMFYLYYEQHYATRQLGAFVMLVITAAVVFLLWYTVTRDAADIQPLVPALQSWWMKIHVPANFIGYGTFSLSAMVAAAYLLKSSGHLVDRLPSLEVLDDVMYKAISVGFAFFTVATILGALWAAEAWGGYWSWDPKETWALIVWLNYAAWLHMRLMTGLRGRVAAWWALVGLLVTTFAFLGVNMFLSGLHSYGKL